MILAHSTAWMNPGNLLVSDVSRRESADSVLCEAPRTRRHTEMKNRGFQDWSRSRTKSSCFWAQGFCLRWWHSRDGSSDGFMPL